MVEALHSWVNQFGPKMYSYTFRSIDSWRNVNCVSSDYIDDLMQEVVEVCIKSRADKPGPLQGSPTLAPRIEKPNKAQAVKERRGRFKAQSINQSTNQSNFYSAIIPARPGSVARQPNQCSTAKSIK